MSCDWSCAVGGFGVISLGETKLLDCTGAD